MSEQILAKAPSACCAKSFVHEGEPSGSITTLFGVETYVSSPADGKDNGNVVFYFPDIFALFNNGKLVMDTIAAAGYTVLGLDYFQGVRTLRNFPVPTY